ncbi:MCP four helix bundle domain-containing protein [Azotosporobacter soli]|uniref:MCP four helix bundle domain-containing protein n=1 Tax=Azotosporobacter soli TaxID=3055040 RepID=UPI0031FEE772
MTILHNQKVAVKITVILSVMLVFTLTVGIVGFFAATNIAQMAEKMYGERLQPIQILDEVRLLSKDTQTALLELIETPEPENRQTLINAIEKNTKEIDRLQDKYEATELDDVERQNWSELQKKLGEYRQVRTEIIALVQENKTAEAFALYRSSKAIVADVLTPRNVIAEYNVRQAHNLYIESSAVAANTRVIIVVVTLLALLLSAGLGVVLARSICLPLSQMLASVKKIAAGKLEETPRSFQSRDELGQLADALVNMRRDLRGLIEESAEKNRILTQEIAERRQIQAALIFSKEKFTKAFRHAGDAVGLVSLEDKRFVEVSEAFFHNLGYERAQVIGHVSSEFDLWNTPEQRSRVYEMMRAGQTCQNEEVVWKTADGARRSGLFSAEVIEIEGKKYSVFVWHDITEQKQAEEVLRKANERLEAEVKRRTQELTTANLELQQANEELVDSLNLVKEMQQQLIEAEKMSALSSLVTGIAHEVNTPVGVGVTAASHLLKTIQDYRAYSVTNKPTRTSFSEFMDSAEELGQMILQNARRTADLIRSFKLVSVDQAQEEKQCFQLKEYLEGVVQSLQSVLKKSGHTVMIECPDDLTLDSYPGAFVQIASNLLMNSLIHAYEPQTRGQMRFTAERREDRLLLCYADDGKGIPADVLSRIFDPFFTTGRGKGCSGLGMHILYNIVTQQLQGSVTCESQLGQGVRFLIELPLETV